MSFFISRNVVAIGHGGTEAPSFLEQIIHAGYLCYYGWLDLDILKKKGKHSHHYKNE